MKALTVKNHFIRLFACAILALVSASLFHAYAEEDWKRIYKNVRIVNVDAGKSLNGDVYRNTINGRYAFLPEPEKRNDMYLIEYADHPDYRYMFTYGEIPFGKRWYFNLPRAIKLPIENDLEFVQVVKAYSGSHSAYWRLFRSVVDGSLTVHGNDFFSWIVYDSDNPKYQYKFFSNMVPWYFNVEQTNAGVSDDHGRTGGSRQSVRISLRKREGR